MRPWVMLAALSTLGAGCATTATGERRDAPPTTEDAMSDGENAPIWTDAATITRMCDEGIERAGRLRAEIKDGTDRDGTAVMAMFNQLYVELDAVYGWAQLMFSVHPSETVRTAAEGCETRLAKFTTEVSLDGGLYEVASAVDPGSLGPVAARFREHLLRDFRRSGVDKDEETRGRLKAMQAEMVDLGQTYQKTVIGDVREVKVKPEILKGLPQDFIDGHPPGSDGLVTLTTQYPDFFPVQTYVEDADLRRDLYLKFMGRAHPANGENLKRLLQLRYEYAQLLGYGSYASYVAEDKMIRSSEAIDAFISRLTTIARPRMEEDLKGLLIRKQEDDEKANSIELWDRFYYVGKVRESRFGFDARELRPYFPYTQVQDGILALYGELFQLEFKADPDGAVWHPSVKAYVVEEAGEVVARFYLDMHPREGKYQHAAMFPIQTGMEGGRLPVASLVCNFPEPGTSSALMEHKQVVTFFHEFGHLIHHLLATRGDMVKLAGINVEWDFVEAPSQILEEWAWDPAVLQRFALHVDTGEPVPTDLVQRMREAQDFGKGANVMRQVFYTAYSYYVHARDPGDLDLDAFTGEIFDRYSPYPNFEGNYVYANFGHLIGYSAIYYTYQWSLVIAKDLFTRFQAAGFMDLDTARDYRRSILEPGGTRDAADLVRDFLGREFNMEAYEAWMNQ